MRKNFKTMCVALILVSAFLATTISVSAADYISNWTTVTNQWDGRDYTAVSVLRIQPDSVDGGSNVGAGIEVAADDGNIIPASYVRGEPRLYLDGALWLAEGWHYTTGTENGIYSEYFTYFVSRTGRVFAKSIFGLYYGNRYSDNFTTAATQTVNIANVTSRSTENETEIQEEAGVNANGQTYGSGWADEIPELIKAIGVGGVNGYVYNSDLLSLDDKIGRASCRERVLRLV